MEEYKLEKTVSLGEWIITLLIMCIPFVNIVMLFVWAFGSNTKPSKANWAKALIVLAVIGLVVLVVLSMLIAITTPAT
ncbi:MAG: hypothetical protein ACQEP8_03560 [Chlamydiota bacterium]